MSMQTETDSKADQAKSAAGDVAGHASEQASQVAGTAKSEAKSVAADAKNQAADVLHATRSELKDRAADQTRALSSTLGDLAGQLDSMADSSDDPEAQMARLAKSAAGQMQQRAQRLDDGGFEGMVDDLKRFARNRPGAFLMGAVVTGFAVGRLAKHADLQQAGQKAKDAASPDDGSSSAGSDRAVGMGGQTDPSLTAGSGAPTGIDRTPATPTVQGATVPGAIGSAPAGAGGQP